MHALVIVFLLFLSYDNTIAEDCELVRVTQQSAVTTYLSGVASIGNTLFESFGPYETCVGIFMDQMGLTTAFIQTQLVMQCTTDFTQEMNEQFRNQINDQITQMMGGFDQLLNSYYRSYQTIKSIYPQTWGQYMNGVASPVNNYLIPLNAAMIANSGFMYPLDSGNLGYALVVLPYLANYINLRVMVLSDLFTWSSRTASLSVAYSLYGTQIYNDLSQAIQYASTSYTQLKLSLRTSQISCNAGSPQCCGSGVSSSCCGIIGDCGEGNYAWDALFDTPDTWRTSWHAPGFPHQENCFWNPSYCSASCMGGPSAWTVWDNNCQSAVTTEQNRLMGLMQTAITNLNTAISNGKTAYSWMCQSSGQTAQTFTTTVAAACFTGDDLIQLKSGETVSFNDLEVGDQVATYFPSNNTYGFSEIGFFAVYVEMDETQYIDLVEICFDLNDVETENTQITNNNTQTMTKRQLPIETVPEPSFFDTNSSNSTTSFSENFLSSLIDNWPQKGYITPLGANCVKLTKNHAVKMFDGSYKYAENASVGDVFWPNSVVSDVSIVRDMGQSLIVPLTWTSPFLVLDNGVILSVFGYYGGSPPELQETHYLQLVSPIHSLCNSDPVSCSQVREIYEGNSVLASTFVAQTVNTSTSAISTINPATLFKSAVTRRVQLKDVQEWMVEHQSQIQNATLAQIEYYLSLINVTIVFNGTDDDGADFENQDSEAYRFAQINQPEIIGISVAFALITILVIIGVIYFVRSRKSSTEAGYEQYK